MAIPNVSGDIKSVLERIGGMCFNAESILTIVTKNEVIMKYVVDKYKNLNEITDVYAEEHEERLIKGLCEAKHSPAYLMIL